MREAVDSSSPRSMKEMWLITIGHGLTHWYPATFYLLLPIIGKELGLSYTETGMIITFQYLASTIANVPGGMLVDTIGKKGLLMALSLFWVGIPYLFMNFTTTYWMLLLCVTLVGIGNNLWHPTAIPTLAQRYPERRGFVLSVHGMAANVGDALAPLAIGALLAVFTWRQIVVINIVPGITMALLIVILLRNLQSGSRKNQEAAGEEKEGQTLKEYVSGLKGLFRNRSLALISTSSAFRSMTQNALLTFLPLYLAHELNYPPLWVGAGLFLLQMGALSPLRSRAICPTSGDAKKSTDGQHGDDGSHSDPDDGYGEIPAVHRFNRGSRFLYVRGPSRDPGLADGIVTQAYGRHQRRHPVRHAVGRPIDLPLLGGMISDKYGLFAAFYFVAGTIVIANLLIVFMPRQERSLDGNESISA